MSETKPDPTPSSPPSPSSPSSETPASPDAEKANSYAHDLPEMRDRFETGVQLLKKGLARLKGSLTRFKTASSNVETLSAAAGGARSRTKRKAAAGANALAKAKEAEQQARRRLLVAMSQWGALSQDFRNGLPKHLCPTVRRVLFADWKLGEQTRIGIGLPPKEEGESEVMEALRQMDEEKLLNMGVLREVHDLKILFHLNLRWPKLRSVEKKGLAAFDAFAKEAKEAPASFWLRPRQTPEVVSAIQDALRWHERPLVERLAAAAGEDEKACEMRLYYNSLLDSQGVTESGGSIVGTTPTQLQKLLLDRWPDVGETKVNTGLVEAFKAGLVRVNGGDAAYRAGCAPKELGEIVDPMCLSRWLAMDSMSRPFEIRLYSVVSPAEAQENAADRQGDVTVLEDGSVSSESVGSVCAVQLRGKDEAPLVFGRAKPVLNSAPYAVIQVLVDAFPRRVKGAELNKHSRRVDARRTLRPLRAADPDWQKAILMAERSGRGYGLAEMP